ncbi:MAG: NADH-quinone oxidoreductase subunit NuoH [Gemmatimonadota bacterium]|jgi:NADH-quinone oxidoreductase subunit H|nr:NADH-quinone oxidoreductase subunit NuoH [Gemmatimonadota bacterium]MDP6802514.1 NADH-quinone oxidoreductase subunit NuoH [Gemmatimonadota bacterium]MDP7031777.1 NADH-quinone oxidoreductase subunit NuoH [Gemmatimonadota bacterium]
MNLTGIIWLDGLLFAGVLAICIAVGALVAVWLERKVSALAQDRLGPMEVGRYHGVLQTIADALKLLQKEDIVPKAADRFLHILAPGIVMGGVIAAAVVIPWAADAIPADLNIGIFYFAAISSLGVIGILLAGWGSNNKWALFGALRAVAQIVSYEIPAGLVLLAAVIFAGSLSTVDIVQSQAGGFWNWMLFRAFPFNFIGMVVFFLAAIAETNRAPFDMPEAESELVAGYHVEYSGMRFAIFFLAEYGAIFMAVAMLSVVYLGGWHAPFPFLDFLPGVFWMVLKVFLLTNFVILVRWSLPRVRVDQLMTISWKYLTPIAFVCVLGAGAMALLP